MLTTDRHVAHRATVAPRSAESRHRSGSSPGAISPPLSDTMSRDGSARDEFDRQFNRALGPLLDAYAGHDGDVAASTFEQLSVALGM